MTWVMTSGRIEERRLGRLTEPPLRLALVQARTTPVLALERSETVERLVAELGGRWILTDRQTAQQIAVQLGPEGAQQHTAPQETVWILTAQSVRAAVSASSVTVETNSYPEWEEFRGSIEEVFAAVHRTLAPARCVRLGMRYVNEVDVSPAEADPGKLAEQLNAALLGPALSLDRNVLGSLAELRVAESDGAVFVVRHGLVNPSTYLLDYDVYREAPDEFDPKSMIARADRFHHRIESVFAWSLNETYLDDLRGEGDKESS
jgi:uncharacterized protein (TIGR04255 family)